MVLNDKQIVKIMSGRIRPFVAKKTRVVDGVSVVSFGLGGAGYDARLSPFPLVMLENDRFIDLKAPDQADYTDYVEIGCSHGRFLIPPHTAVLGTIIEYIDVPNNIVVNVVGKSSYARCGIHLNVTPIEPGWRGYLTIEMTNQTGSYAAVYAGEGICQLQFHELSGDGSPYTGAYQDQPARPFCAVVG